MVPGAPTTALVVSTRVGLPRSPTGLVRSHSREPATNSTFRRQQAGHPWPATHPAADQGLGALARSLERRDSELSPRGRCRRSRHPANRRRTPQEPAARLFEHASPALASQWGSRADPAAPSVPGREDRSGQGSTKHAVPLRDCPITEIARLGRTLRQWKDAYLCYFATGGANNGGTEAGNGIIEPHRRIARGDRNPDNYRLRMLLVAGGVLLPQDLRRAGNPVLEVTPEIAPRPRRPLRALSPQHQDQSGGSGVARAVRVSASGRIGPRNC